MCFWRSFQLLQMQSLFQTAHGTCEVLNVGPCGIERLTWVCMYVCVRANKWKRKRKREMQPRNLIFCVISKKNPIIVINITCWQIVWINLPYKRKKIRRWNELNLSNRLKSTYGLQFLEKLDERSSISFPLLSTYVEVYSKWTFKSTVFIRNAPVGSNIREVSALVDQEIIINCFPCWLIHHKD